MDQLLDTIQTSVDATRQSVEKTQTELDSPVPEIVEQLSRHEKPEGMSLLALKNSCMLSYLNNIALVLLSQLERTASSDGLNEKAVIQSIVQRVTMERGIKGLEKRLSYQLEKSINAFQRMEKQDTEAPKANDSEEDSEDEQDGLAFKPDASAFADKQTEDKYKPPKISAVAPPKGKPTDRNEQRHKKLQSMEEYLRESSDMPSVEQSIGSNIVSHGRDGVKTSRDKEKEEQIQRYEESNFTRLPSTMTKKSSSQKRKEQQDHFAGEDWSMFSKDRDDDMRTSSSRRKKATSAWDRAKKRRVD